jgi:16S rRNA (cytosine967-C5)-methyltransferase
MTDESPSPRDVAVWALMDRAGNVSANLERLLGRGDLATEDRALAHELAMGATRRRGTLAAVQRAYLAQPDRRLPGALNEILQIGLYQLLFLERVPDFAAVDEAVEQAIRHRHRRQSGLVNGLLRTVARGVSAIQTGPVPLAPDVLPVGPSAWRRFNRPVFPDPDADPRGYLAAAHSLPPVLAARWLEQAHSLEKATAWATHANCRPPLVLRVNALRTSAPAVLAGLEAEGVAARLHANGTSIVLDRHLDVRNLAAFREGLVQPQDATGSAVVAQAVQPRGGQEVLDFCAAPGTKTTHLAERMGNAGSITAVDTTAEKLLAIESNCRRLGATIVRTMLADQVGGMAPGNFDVALVDTPCSNTGVLARRVEARWRFDEVALAKLVKDQRFLLAAAGQFVRRGGRLVYSTCSIEPEECGDLARAFARRSDRFRLLSELLTLPAGADDPTRWYDGGYYAVFQG